MSLQTKINQKIKIQTENSLFHTQKQKIHQRNKICKTLNNLIKVVHKAK